MGRMYKGDKKPGGIMLVGEAPGAEEDVQGLPFVGRAGAVLDAVLEDSSVSRWPIYITNAAKCRPRNNRKPKIPTEARVCVQHWLTREIEKLKPALIVTLGDTPLQTLVGITGIWKHMGRVFESPHTLGVPVMPNFHPAAVLHSRREWQAITDAMVRVFDKADNYLQNKGKTRGLRPRQCNIEETREDHFRAAFDTETTGLEPKAAGFMFHCCTVAFAPEVCYTFMLPHDREALIECLLSQQELVGHNIKFDARVVMSIMNTKEKQEFFRKTWWCTMALAGLNDPTYQNLKLDHLAHMHLDHTPYKEDEAYAALAGGKLTKQMVRINQLDACLTYSLLECFPHDTPVSRWVCNDVVKTATLMEERGIHIDEKQTKKLIKYYERQRAKHEPALTRIVDNPGSRMQVSDYLKARLPEDVQWAMGDTKTGQLKLDKNALSVLEKADVDLPFVKHYNKWNRANKWLGTYLNTLREQAPTYRPDIYVTSHQEGRFGTGGTVTGRLTMSLLQTFPRDGELKACITSFEPGGYIVVADYQQAELLVGATLAGAERMLRAFEAGDDLHVLMGHEIFGKRDISDEERQIAKRTNFATIFVVTAKGLKTQLMVMHGISRTIADCTHYISSFYRLNPEFSIYNTRQMQQVQEQGIVYSPTGRWLRTSDKRVGVNMPIQSGSADLNTMAMTIARLKYNLRVFINHYDAIGIDVGRKSKTELKKVIKLIKHIMVVEAPQELERRFGWKLPVAPRVDIKVGKCWK